MQSLLVSSIVSGALLLAMACDVGAQDSRGQGGQAAAGSGGYGASDAGSVSCSCKAPRHPFGTHTPYTSGTLMPSASAAERDRATVSFYELWKQRHLRTGCGADRYYVAAEPDASTLTVSEAHGYGMLIAVLMAGHDPNSKANFDGMYRYFREHPAVSSSDLMAWRQDKQCSDDADSASDGDLDIAYALLLADKQWGSCDSIDYLAEAKKVLWAIRRHEVDTSGRWLLLGDWATPSSQGHYRATRTSDFMPGHLRSFELATGDPAWHTLSDALHGTLRSVQSAYGAATGLLPDFVVSVDRDPRPAPPEFLERPVDGAYSFNACRNPWRLGVDYLTSGDSRSQSLLEPLNAWISSVTAGEPSAVRAGYALDGAPLPRSEYLSMAFLAPLGVGAMVSAEQSWVDAVFTTVVEHEPDDSYYEDTLKLLSLIAMSGNWWAPEAIDCDAAAP